MVPVPLVTLARQVPQTPPLQANGRPGRIFWAPSRIAVPGGRVRVEERPSSTTVTVAPSPGGCSSWVASSGGSSPTQNSSRWMRPASTPNPVSTSIASVTRPNGPHSHQWSTRGTSTVTGSSSASRPASRRPLNSSTSWAARDSTGTIRVRAGWASLRSATSSANMTVSLRRLPYSRVTVDLSSAASTEAAIDIIGVMPEPAAISTWWPGTDRSGVNEPPGLWTWSVSPAFSSRTSQPDTAPPATSRTPIRGGDPAAAQIEYDRRSPSRSMVRLCPGANANSPASSSGTANVRAAASSVSGSTPATRNEWNCVLITGSSPCRVRVGPGQRLQLGQQVTQGLGVHAVAAGPAADPGQRRRLRAVQAGGGQHGVQHRVHVFRLDPGQRVGVGPEQLAHQGPQRVQRGLHAGVRQGSAVAQPDHPLGGVVAVVGQLLDPLGRDGRQHRVRDGGQRGEQGQPPAGEDQQPAGHLGEVRVLVLGQPDVAELFLLAEEGQLILGPAEDPAGPGQQHPRLAQQVEGDVGNRGFFLQLGQAGHPLLQPVAVDQRVVAQGQAVPGQRPGVQAVRHRGVDALQRVGEPGAERPPVTVVVVLAQQVIRVVVVSHTVSPCWLTCGGRRRGSRRTSGAGTPCHRTGRRTGPSRPGWTR